MSNEDNKKAEEQDASTLNAEDFVLSEENEDPKESVIERHNIVSRFTMKDIENHQQDLEKMRQETDAQVRVCQGTVDNIVRNHPWIADLSDEERHHVWMYEQNNNVLKQGKPKLEEINRQMGIYAELMDILHEKFGFVQTSADDVDKTDDNEQESTNKKDKS